MMPTTKYGQSYDVYDAAIDKLSFSYWDLEQPQVNLDRDNQQVNVLVDSSHGYAGFEHSLADTLFGTFKKWTANKLIFHTTSEHTVNGERYDIELQILHVPYTEPVHHGDNHGGDDSYDSGSGHRRLATKDEGASDDILKLGEEEDPDAPRYTEGQKYIGATIGVLFDSENYDPISDENREIVNKFIADFSLEVDDPIVDKISFGKFM